jgi:hypothetical protein
MGKMRVVAVVFALTLCAIAVAWACHPPVVGVNGIGDGDTVSGAVALEITATSESTVVGVDVYVDDALLATLTTSPYKHDLDTTKLTNGSHKLYAKARAYGRPDGVSPTISFTVKNEAETPPTADAGSQPSS